MKSDVQVKRVSLVTNWVVPARSRMLPFKISLAQDEIVHVLKFRIRIAPALEAVSSRLDWSLIQKHEVSVLEQDLGALITRDEDFDTMARGNFQYATGAITAEVNRNRIEPDDIDFPQPFRVPRSPTLELYTDSTTPNWAVQAELYYQKERVSNKEVMLLLKRWVGRKQNVVSNIPRVIDE